MKPGSTCLTPSETRVECFETYADESANNGSGDKSQRKCDVHEFLQRI